MRVCRYEKGKPMDSSFVEGDLDGHSEPEHFSDSSDSLVPFRASLEFEEFGVRDEIASEKAKKI